MWQRCRIGRPEMSMNSPVVSLKDLVSAGIPMHQAEAVAVARDVIIRRARGELPGIPAAKSLRLSSDGTVTVGEPIPVGNDLERAAALLEALLAQATREVSSPAALRLILGRAYASDAAAFGSLDEFVDALTPFAAADASAFVRSLVANHPASLDPPEAVPLASPVPSPEPVTLRPAPDRRRRSVTVDVPDYEPPNRLLWIAAAAAGAVFVILLGSQWMSREQPGQAVHQPGLSHRHRRHPRRRRQSSPTRRRPRASAAPSAVAQPRAITTLDKAAAPARLRHVVTPAVAADSGAEFSPELATVASAMFFGPATNADGPSVRPDAKDDGRVLRVVNVRDDRGSSFHPRPSPDRTPDRVRLRSGGRARRLRGERGRRRCAPHQR